MLTIVKIIGVLLIALGIIFFLKPLFMRKWINFLRRDYKIYIIGFLRIVFGILFLFAVSGSRLPGVILALGILMLLSGVFILILGPKKGRKILDWYEKKSDNFCRILAVLVFAIGLLIMYSA